MKSFLKIKSFLTDLLPGRRTISPKPYPLHNRFRRRVTVFCLLLSAGILGWLHMEQKAAARQASIAGKILRLHVLANSDSAEDQALKLQVRDGILAYMAANAPAFDNVTEAKKWTAAHMEQLRQTAVQIIRSQGHGEPVTLELTSCYFPVKTYGDLTFPAGTYEALRVRIGAAEGQNWWCVMYPPLCFTDATCATFPETSQEILKQQLTTEEFLSLRRETISAQKTPEIRFKLLELLLETD